MQNSVLPSDLAQEIFSLPFSKGECPFDLSQEERLMSPDDWAWLFLRRNPLYQHDYALWKAATMKPREITALFRHNGFILPRVPGAPDSSVPEELRALDSRYFMLDGAPLGNEIDQWTYKSETLGDYLDRHADIDLKAVRMREFDAPGDYGIGAWLDPALRHTPKLPSAPATGCGSWFYHVNEPIWEVHPDRPMQAELLRHELPDGQKIAFGRDHYTRVRDRRENAPLAADRKSSVDEQPHPPSITLLPSSLSPNLATTQLRFLVCLDGYVRPQLDLAFQLASEFRELHKVHDPDFATGSSLAQPVKIEKPETPAGHSSGIFKGLDSAAVRIRKHWCAVTIDVVGPLGGQQEQLEATLLKAQNALGKKLTYPIRQRSPHEKVENDNPLKRALSIVELRRLGSGRGKNGSVMSYGRINKAIYCNDTADYYHVRDESSKVAARVRKGGVRELGKPEHVRASLKLGQGMVMGWYELLASRKF